jgi:hypothetical protein
MRALGSRATPPLLPPPWPATTASHSTVVNSTISYAVSGKQYVMVFTGEGQSVTAGPLGLTKDKMPPAVRRHNSFA